jgi:hypothetical protein
VLYLKGKLKSVDELPPRGDFKEPMTWLTVIDEDGERIGLRAARELHEAATALVGKDVALRLSRRQVPDKWDGKAFKFAAEELVEA